TLNAQSVDIRADIYSLGCTLYYLLSGGPPFRGSSLYEILQAHHAIEAKPLDQVRSDLPAELAGVVAKMMAKDPEHRFQTPAQVASVLARFFKKGSLASSPQLAAKPVALGSAAVERPEVPRPTPVTEGGSDQAAAVGPLQVRSIPTWFTVA